MNKAALLITSMLFALTVLSLIGTVILFFMEFWIAGGLCWLLIVVFGVLTCTAACDLQND